MNLFLLPRRGWQATGSRPLRGRIGIDIGTHSVKCVQVERIGDAWRLGRHCQVELPQQGPSDNEPASSLLSLLEPALGRQPRLCRLFAGKRTACALPMSLVEQRSLQIPQATRDEMRDLLREELAAEGRFDDFEFDWWQADAGGAATDGASRVSVVSAPTSLASDLALCLDQAGFDCEVLDGMPTTLARAAVLAEGSQQHEPTAVLDLGYSTPLVTFVQQGTPVFFRQLPGCGLRHLLEALSKSLAMAEQDCGRLLSRHGITAATANDGELPKALAQLAMPFLRQLLVQLDRTLSYVQQHYRLAYPRQIWLSGGGGMLPGLDLFLSDQLGHPVGPWQMASSCPSAQDIGCQPLLAAAIALSLIDEVS